MADVGDYPTEACVQFARAGGPGNFCDIARVEAAAGQNRDAIPSLLKERSKNGRASLCVGSAT